MTNHRSSGILLHPTSLPGSHGIGSLGNEAKKFIDFLKKGKQAFWQILPLGPTGYGDSPYQCFSSKAGNPYLIDLDLLKENALLMDEDLVPVNDINNEKVAYGNVIDFKLKVLKSAQQNFEYGNDQELKNNYNIFVEENNNWLDDYSFFMALKEKFDKRPWYEWEDIYRLRNMDALETIKPELEDTINFHKFMQFIFSQQWTEIKSYANNNSIKIIGDIPIYVSMDSVETWVIPELFQFDENKNPISVGGCPPDYFSENGQLWGNPIFNYEEMEKDEFSWWIDRIKYNLKLYDLVRVDHFRGFSGYWSIPYGEETAINGRWVNGPGQKLFSAIKNALGDIPIIAEDLGLITEDVIELRDAFNLPGMKVLQFAFDSSEENDYLPHNYDKNCIVYTGTHDNETVIGWFENAKEEDKKYVLEYINSNGENISWDLIRAAWASVANIAITPMQDLLGLGGDARMNLPGSTVNNWEWRMNKEQINDGLEEKLARITELYGRT